MRSSSCRLVLVLALHSTDAAGQAPALSPLSETEAGTRTLLEEGIGLYEQGQIKDALMALRASMQEHPSNEARYYIGVILRLLGRYVEAGSELETYLAAGGDAIPPDRRAEIGILLSDIAQNVGLVRFVCEVEGARLFVDTRRVATLPMAQPMKMDAGTHLVEVEADGYEVSSKQVYVPGGKSRTFEILLVESGSGPDPCKHSACPPGSTCLERDGAAACMVPLEALAAEGLLGEAMRLREIGAGLMSAASVFLGAGLALVPLGSALTRSCLERCDGSRVGLGPTLLVTGGVLLAISLPLFITGATLGMRGMRLEQRAPQHPMPFIAASPGGASLGLHGSFW